MSRLIINDNLHQTHSEENNSKSHSALKKIGIASTPPRISQTNRNTLLNSRRFSVTTTSTTSSDTSLKRRAHFDPENLEKTYKPSYKDYGYIKITQAATPFPHRTLGQDIQLLKPKTSKIFDRELRKEVDVILPRAFNSTRLTRPLQMDFETKRKKFYEGEFTITRQRRSMLVHPPLKSLGDVSTINRFQSSYMNLTKFFRKHYRQRTSEELDDY